MAPAQRGGAQLLWYALAALAACPFFGTSLRARGPGRFPYSCILVSHMPKAGGTTLRHVIRMAAKEHSQRVELCYGHEPVCRHPWAQEVVNELPGEVDFFKGCEQNQIVFGHQVLQGFEKHMRVPPQKLARVVVMREPISQALSLYIEQSAQKLYNGTLSDFVFSQELVLQLDEFLASVKELELDDNLSVVEPVPISSAWKANDTASAFRNVWQQRNTLVMVMEDYVHGVKRLAQFLNVSEEIRDEMIGSCTTPENIRSAGNTSFTLTRQAWERLLDVTKPLREAYRAALVDNGIQDAAAFEPAAHFDGDLVTITK